MPISASGTYVTIGLFYGVSGASDGGECYVHNEALARAMTDADVPYIFLTDANIQKQHSQILQAVIQGNHLIDVRADRYPDNPNQPTFCSGGITAPLTAGDSGCTPIDHVLTNASGNDMIQDLVDRWDLTKGLDHVPIDIIMNTQGHYGTHCALQAPTKIDVAALLKLNDSQVDFLYKEVRNQCDEEIEEMLNTSNLDTKHFMWSKVQEVFLHTWATLNHVDQLPTHASHIAHEIIYANRNPDACNSSDMRIPKLYRGTILNTREKQRCTQYQRQPGSLKPRVLCS